MRNVLIGLSIIGLSFSVNSCNKDDQEKGTVNFEITDAPIDDASVEGAFVTVADVKADGNSVEGFNKTTIDLLAYQRGNTKLLSSSELDASSYSNVTLVLDYDEDADGNSPGCYIEDVEGNKHALTSGSSEITSNHSFMVESEGQSELVFDFDLRKNIQRTQDTTDQYNFVTGTEMENGVRVVNKSETGVVNGNCENSGSNGDKVVVYAYAQGTYDQETETSGQGQSNVMFANAVTSAEVDANGDFEMHYLEEGAYELKYCSYEENSEGKMMLNGQLSVNALGSVNTDNVSVSSSSSVTVDVEITGLLGL